jgi:FKBP-type peptidyl-prolyl cis-trans isomerase
MLFDTSSSHNAEGTFEFVMDESAFIRGWTDGMRVINEGALVYLIIPSEFGYGATGSYTIGPYETLIFAIEMVDIKQAY